MRCARCDRHISSLSSLVTLWAPSREDELARTFDTAKPAAIREDLKRSDAVDGCAGSATCRIGIGLGDVVADALEAGGGVRGPADAHQPG